MEFLYSLRISDQILDLEEKNTAAVREAVFCLERLIGSIALHSAVGRELIQLKRDIFNDRAPRTPLSDAGAAEIRDGLPPRESALLWDWIENRHKREMLVTQGEDVIAREIAAQSMRLRNITRRSAFRAALDLASPALSEDLRQYRERPSRFSAGQKSRIERSLVRYYTRSAVKLSPFSSFMSTRILRIIADESRCVARRPTLRRSVKTNRSIPAQLAQLISKHPKLRQVVPVSVSGAVVRTGDKILVLRQRYDGSTATRLRIPAESLVELEYTRAMAVVMDHLSSGGQVPFMALVSAMAPLLGEPNTTSDFIAKLSDIGVLLHKIPLPQDDSCPVDALRKFLAALPAPDSRLSGLAQELERLGTLQAQFSAATLDLRPAVVKAIDATVRNAHHLIEDVPPPDWTGRLIFEEVIEEPAGTLRLPDPSLPAVQDLAAFLQVYVPLLDLFSSVRASMREVLLKQFGGGPVPFLKFAAHYRRAMPFVKGAKSAGASLRNPLKLEILTELEKIRSEIGSMAMLRSSAVELDLRKAAQENRWSQRVLELGLPDPIGGKAVVTCFIQPFTDSNGAQSLVVNQIDAGPCRTLSRTLAGSEDWQRKSEIGSDVAQALNTLWNGAEPCAISAAFDYNLNACPALTERTIDYAGDAAPGEDSIPLGSLFISVTASGDLRLSVEGRDVLPVHFGAMSSAYQPLIPALLLALGRSEPILVRPFDPRNWEPIPATMPDIMHFPRLVFGRCIARRQAWLIRKEMLPRRKGGESPFAHFIRVRKWQRELELPDEVFVRVRALGERGNEDPGHARSSGLPHKPQYVDFRNYFLVESLDDLFKDVLTAAYLEEALPTIEDWTRMGLGRAIEVGLDAFITTGSGSATSTQSFDPK